MPSRRPDVCVFPPGERGRIPLIASAPAGYCPAQLIGVSLRENRGAGMLGLVLLRKTRPLRTAYPRGPFSFWTEGVAGQK